MQKKTTISTERENCLLNELFSVEILRMGRIIMNELNWKKRKKEKKNETKLN